jgi:periplasmic protein TonB
MKLFLTPLLLAITQFAFSQKKPTTEQLFDTVYTKPEVLASYPGGEAAWKKYVKKHMKYPRKAWWDEIESEVAVKLIIEKDGRVSEAYHLNVTSYGFEQEAIRLIKNSGKWIPAMHRGKPVKSEGMLTIEFRLK